MTGPTDAFTLAERVFSGHREILERLEKRRINHLLFIGLFSCAGAAVSIPCLSALELYLFHTSFPAVANGIAGFMASLAFSFVALDRSYRHKIKSVLLPVLAKHTGLQYRRGGFFRLGDIYDHHILPPYAGHASQEGFQGRIDGFRLAFQDFWINPVRRLGRFDARSAFMHFYGLAIRVELHKTMDFHTILIPSAFANGLLKISLHEKFGGFEKIGIPYPIFNRRYCIISEHQVEARYIFDPAVIERVIALGEHLGAGWMEISVKNREMVIIAGQPRNLFETGHLFDVVDIPSLERTLNQLHMLTDAARILELSPYAGLGGTVNSAILRN